MNPMMSVPITATTQPAWWKALGIARIPVPREPFSRCIKVWESLWIQRNDQYQLRSIHISKFVSHSSDMLRAPRITCHIVTCYVLRQMQYSRRWFFDNTMLEWVVIRVVVFWFFLGQFDCVVIEPCDTTATISNQIRKHSTFYRCSWFDLLQNTHFLPLSFTNPIFNWPSLRILFETWK